MLILISFDFNVIVNFFYPLYYIVDAASKWNLPGSLYEGLLSDILIGGTCISISRHSTSELSQITDIKLIIG